MTKELHECLALALNVYKESLTKLTDTKAFWYLEEYQLEKGLCHYLSVIAPWAAKREFYAIFNDRYPDRHYLCIPPDRAVMFGKDVRECAVKPRIKFLEALLDWPITESESLHQNDKVEQQKGLTPALEDLFTFDQNQ
jgi:hypothetical protein